jgi:polyisoprenyl-phosphate glycosyltransferase
VRRAAPLPLISGVPEGEQFLKISIVTPTYNEEENVEELHARIRAAMATLSCDYEHIFIDNASTDRTVEKVKSIIANDPKVRLIVNTRNFGHIRSPAHAILQASGDAVVCMSSDLQDPPELIPQFVEKWRAGWKIVLGVKQKSEETALMWFARRSFYSMLYRIAEVKPVQNATGFGVYDRVVVELLRASRDPYPYFRGFLAETGYPIASIPFVQPLRKRGFTKNNIFTLYDYAMLAFVNHSKIPLRITSFVGFFGALASLVTGLVYTTLKIVHWNDFELGIAPAVVGVFLIGSMQLLFLGVIGEYIGFIFTRMKNDPLVIEKERINFD